MPVNRALVIIFIPEILISVNVTPILALPSSWPFPSTDIILTTYKFDETNSINFSTRKNKKTDLTEFYNLIYQYQNDCLVAAIEYNKNYYEDRDIKPSEDIFFSLTITPFTSINSPNLSK